MYLCTNSFILVIGFKEFWYFHFSHSKNAKYAKIDREDSLDANQKFHLFKHSDIFTILLWSVNNLKFVKQSENMILVET